MSTDIKLSEAQTSKLIQSGGSVCHLLSNLSKKVQTNVAIPFPRDNLTGLVSNIASSAVNKFERKISGKKAVRVGKGFTLFISNEDMIDMIRIIKSRADLGVLIDGVSETATHEIQNKKVNFLVLH